MDGACADLAGLVWCGLTLRQKEQSVRLDAPALPSSQRITSQPLEKGRSRCANARAYIASYPPAEIDTLGARAGTGEKKTREEKQKRGVSTHSSQNVIADALLYCMLVRAARAHLPSCRPITRKTREKGEGEHSLCTSTTNKQNGPSEQQTSRLTHQKKWTRA